MLKCRSRGQLLDIMSTVLFVVVLFSLCIFGLFFLLKAWGAHSEGTIKIVGSSLDDWAMSRMLEEKIGDRSILQMMMQSAAMGTTEQNDAIKDKLISAIAGFQLRTYDITWKDSASRRIGWINSIAKSCGDFTDAANPKFAYCEQSCTYPRIDVSENWGRGKCSEDERCCYEPYDFTQKKYVVPLCQGDWGGCECIGADGYRGVWTNLFGVCTPGSISIGFYKERNCCRPATESELREMVQEVRTTSSVPLLYRKLSGNVMLTFGLFSGEKTG